MIDRRGLGGRLVGVDLAFEQVEWLAGVEPAASVRLLLPSAPDARIEIPTWNGNEFLLSDGRRPVLRTLTPIEVDDERSVLRLAVLRHGRSPLSTWLAGCSPGDEVGVSGPGRGLTPDPSIHDWVLAGDESAVPAIDTLLRSIPPTAMVRVLIELDAPGDGRPALTDHPGARVDWAVLPSGSPPGDTLVRRVAHLALAADTLLWAAGEAAAMHRIRGGLDRGTTPRSMTVVRGYWKVNGPGRSAGSKPSTAP